MIFGEQEIEKFQTEKSKFPIFCGETINKYREYMKIQEEDIELVNFEIVEKNF